MKLFYLVVLLGAFFIPLNAQKTEFGLVMKAGAYTVPFKNREIEVNYYADRHELSSKPGSNYALGIWHTIPLSKKLRLGTELLFRVTNVSVVYHSQGQFYNGVSQVFTSSERYQDSYHTSLSLPIKLQLTPSPNSKFAMELGFGITQKLSFLSQNKIVRRSSTENETEEHYQIGLDSWDKINPVFSFYTGVRYNINQQTALGIEYLFEKNNDYDLGEPLIIFGPQGACNCLFSYPDHTPNINSFSVSLRHNILH